VVETVRTPKTIPARRVEQELGGLWTVCEGEGCPMTRKPRLGAVPELRLKSGNGGSPALKGTSTSVRRPSASPTPLRPLPAVDGNVKARVQVTERDFLDGALSLRARLTALAAANKEALYHVTLLITPKLDVERDTQMLGRAQQLDEILQSGGIAAKQIGFRTVPTPHDVKPTPNSLIGEIAVISPWMALGH
jgi:hypothetical protein